MANADSAGQITGIGKSFWELIELYYWQGATVKQAIQAAKKLGMPLREGMETR